MVQLVMCGVISQRWARWGEAHVQGERGAKREGRVGSGRNREGRVWRIARCGPCGITPQRWAR